MATAAGAPSSARTRRSAARGHVFRSVTYSRSPRRSIRKPRGVTRARSAVMARHAALPMAATASAEGVARRADAEKSAAAREATIAACRRRLVRFQARRFFQTIASSERHGAAALLGREGFEAARVAAGPKRGAPRGLGERGFLEADGRESDARIEDAHEAESGRQRERERAGGRSQKRGENPAERGEEREWRRAEGPGLERGDQTAERGEPLLARA